MMQEWGELGGAGVDGMRGAGVELGEGGAAPEPEVCWRSSWWRYCGGYRATGGTERSFFWGKAGCRRDRSQQKRMESRLRM